MSTHWDLRHFLVEEHRMTDLKSGMSTTGYVVTLRHREHTPKFSHEDLDRALIYGVLLTHGYDDDDASAWVSRLLSDGYDDVVWDDDDDDDDEDDA
jgi:hypothetical protein